MKSSALFSPSLALCIALIVVGTFRVNAQAPTDGTYLGEFEVSSESLYVQQTGKIYIWLYSSDVITDIGFVSRDFGSLEVGTWTISRNIPDREVDGQRMQTVRLEASISGSSPGKHPLNAEIQMSLRRLTGRLTQRSGRMYPEAIHFTKTVSIPPGEFIVKEPPKEGRPKSYKGAIGQFLASATVSPTKLKVGEPITVRSTLKGRGNMRHQLPPTYGDVPGFRVMDASLVKDNSTSSRSITEKVIEQVLIPTDPTITELPPLRFSWFDPRDERYEEQAEGPFPLELQPADDAATNVGTSAPISIDPRQPKKLGDALRYLKEPTRLHSSQMALDTGVVLFALPVALWLLAGPVTGFFLRTRGDEQARQHRRLPRATREELTRLADSEEATSAYTSVEHILKNTIAYKLGIPAHTVSLESIRFLDPELTTTWRDWLQRMDHGRFGPGKAETVNGSDLQKELQSFLDRIRESEVGR